MAVNPGAVRPESFSHCFKNSTKATRLVCGFLTEASASFRIPRAMGVYGLRRKADGCVVAPSTA